ncbi:MAG TPA: peptidase E [Vicinamibacterales bacterium]|nr:peptidase E [Vicinamibacterales bacterium]
MAHITRHIVAIGGAAFRAEPENLAADRYILDLTGTRRPSVCFIPTASAEPADVIAKFEDAYARLGAVPSVLRFFQRTPDLRATILSQDVLYVGGGNTKSMLAVWREWGLEAVLREAWQKGIVLAGVSAGAICWFERGVTDSWADRLRPLDCLGFLPGACCPHYDSEEDRRPSVHEFVADGTVSPVLALDDGAAAHFVGRQLHRVVTWKPAAQAFSVWLRRGRVVEARLPLTKLRPVRPRGRKKNR